MGGRPVACRTAELDWLDGDHETLHGLNDCYFLCCHKTEVLLLDVATQQMDRLADVHVAATFTTALGRSQGRLIEVNEQRGSPSFQCRMIPEYLFAENY